MKSLRGAATAAWVVLLMACQSTSIAEPVPCGEAEVITLCVTVDGHVIEVQRLASTNVLHTRPSEDLRDDAYIDRLIEVPLGEMPLELSVRPVAGLQTTEVSLYTSVATLTTEPPILGAQCENACGSWYSNIDSAQRVVHVPVDEVSDGNVLVVSTFVESPPLEIGAVSWGIVLRDGHATGPERQR